MPTNILLLVSDPLDAPVSIERDLNALQDALRDVPAAAQFTTRIARAEDVQSLMSRGDRPTFDVLHYLGHGSEPTKTQEGRLIFENADGNADALNPAQLKATFANSERDFKLAMISACHSESVAQAMFDLGVEHVVAIDTDQSVYKIAAVTFCKKFYITLLTGRNLQAAFNAGASAVRMDEQLRGMGEADREADKFKLLPAPGANPEKFTLPAERGEVDLEGLPQIPPERFTHKPADEFLGRGSDMANALKKLREKGAVCLLGASGAGKTELAKQMVMRLAARGQADPARVGFAALIDCKTAQDVRERIALSLRLKADELPDDAALANAIPKNAVLILDEAENVIDSDGFAVRNLMEVLIASPRRPRVIVTSQTDPGAPHLPTQPVRQLPNDAAIRLFALCARLGGQMRRINMADVLRVFEFVDGLPRAIELVARTWRNDHAHDPEAVELKPLLAELTERQDRLMRDPRYPKQVKGVTLGIQLAYDRLSAQSVDAANLFAQLGLFPGGVPRHALPFIFGDGADQLGKLIENQSLVELPFAHLDPPFGDLLVLPAPFRFFALRQLPNGEAAARDALGEAALKFYQDFEDEPHLGWVGILDRASGRGGQNMGAFIARYQAELPSFETWLDWGYAHEPCANHKSRAARLTGLLENIYVITNVFQWRKERFEAACDTALICGDAADEANTRLSLGDLLMREDDLGGAREQYEKALAIYHAITDRLGEANTRQALGDLLGCEGDLSGAREQYQKALAIYPVNGGEANTRLSLGDLLVREGDLGGAREQYQKALAIYLAIGDRLGEANVYRSLGQLALVDNKPENAFQSARAALEIHAGMGDQFSMAGDFIVLGQAAGLAGSHAQAVSLLEQSIEINKAVSEKRHMCQALVAQAQSLFQLGAYDAAFAAWWQVRAIARAIGFAPMVARVDDIFSQFEPQTDPAQWRALIQALEKDAEGIRLAVVAKIVESMNQSQ